MDMSDLNPASAAPDALPDDDANTRWHTLVSDVGAEIAGPLTAALEHIHALTTTGHIDRAALRSLRDQVERARQVGITAQQLARFAAGRMRQSHERLALADTVKTVLTHRARETHARGITLKPMLKAVDVVADASLLFSLLNTLLDWAVVHAKSQIEFAIDLKSWPPHARLVCRFALHPADRLDDGAPVASGGELDSTTWRLLEQTALTMGLPLNRTVDGVNVALTLEFPRTVNDEMEGVSTFELDQGFAPSTNSKPLAGSHVLVIASRRDVRVQVRDAIRHMGLIVDMVASVDEASDFCREGLPHAVVFEAILSGEKLGQLRAEISGEVPDFPFIEIIEQGTDFAMSGFGGSDHARVGREALDSALPSVLMFELSKAL